MDSKLFTNWFIDKQPIYKRLGQKVESILLEVFDEENVSYHMVTSRVKDIESARKKSGNDKYTSPTDIQDLAGIRVITYVEDEVKYVTEIIERLFDIDKENSSNKSNDLGTDRVGYKSVHYVAKLKSDRLALPEYRQYANKCFEIQVRTILQHAWAEIEHDRNYKFSGELSNELTRRFKLVAGVLELADKEFNSISREIDDIAKNVSSGNLDIELSSSAFSSFIRSRYSGILEDIPLCPDQEGVGVSELKQFGITTIEALDKIVPADFDRYLKSSAYVEDGLFEIGIARCLMILNDYDKFFKEVYTEGSWEAWASHHELTNEDDTLRYFDEHGVDWDVIQSRYHVSFCPN
ncbi:hypothetical protein PQE20_21590 [Vibrio harveyi]|uniref:GTP pyrophosphokinase n=1 Tax=Vibrio harveyi TaxID=669 RepID=UPI00234CC8CD|nr:hypothetical protein [Vibrio harveyi]WCP84010.1 hypothetical protein PQE20_21590 [Vibrio harveyi]